MSAIHDDQAERHVAAVAMISRHGALLAAQRLEAHEFHDPRAWRAIEAACRIAEHPPGDDGPIDNRIEAVATTAGLWVVELRRWVAECPTMWDSGAYFAIRVIAAAERRRRVFELVAEIEELGVKVEVAL